MSDLINGREMLKRYQEDLCYGIACKDCSMCTEDGGCRVEEWIDNFPSVDIPQGEWIDVNGDGSLWRCDQCKDTACCKGNFCPNCGARMKGADDDNA